ncbi:hypothetical protein CEXT_28911 [Caerostris extrusa]|uniref:Uncharacterized protein n=1 Tax=Caerostris extrusa TaxID=172846 RepID=A0AAV4Y7M7_CAEEX|nr:hypothetical protein CEXT_28911 [Caerostris extrusa]
MLKKVSSLFTSRVWPVFLGRYQSPPMRWERSLSLINTSIDQTPVPLRLIRAIKPDSWGSKGAHDGLQPLHPESDRRTKTVQGREILLDVFIRHVFRERGELADFDDFVSTLYLLIFLSFRLSVCNLFLLPLSFSCFILFLSLLLLLCVHMIKNEKRAKNIHILRLVGKSGFSLEEYRKSTSVRRLKFI